MPERVVVSFRGLGSSRAGAPSYLERALGMRKRAEAFGARTCAWSAQTFSFDFEPDEIEEAVSLAIAAGTEERVSPEERFGVGISEGPLEPVGEGGSFASLSWGPPLLVAVSLARIAHPGQVLLDPDLPAVLSGELLVASSRVAMDMGKRLRGLVLDSAQPWRRLAARNVMRLAVPTLLGLDEALSELAIPAGALGVVRAEAGAGGTRVLAEATAKLAPPCVLFVAPVGASREPLGAIRRALSRASALRRAPTLPERLRGALDRLLAGDGADPFSAAELVDAWLPPENGSTGVVAIDDAREIDAASLEAVTSAIQVRGGFRILARLVPSMPMPEALSSLHLAASIDVPALTKERAERLVASFAGGDISLEAVARWAKRGGLTPLGVHEALAEGLASGELAWNDAVAAPRSRSAGKGGALTARRWIEKRLAFLSAEARPVLTALALLGGDASDVMIDALAAVMAGRRARVASTLDEIVATGFAARPEPGWLKLSSRTARDAIAAQEGEARRAWHAAAAATIEQRGGLLGRADAAWHASIAGDRPLAARLAIDAATAAVKAGLDLPAMSLLAFARDHDPAQAEVARAEHFRTAKGSLPPPPPSVRQPLDGLEEETAVSLVPSEPRPRFDTLVDDSMFTQFEPAAASAAAAPAPAASKPPPLPANRTRVERAREALVQGDVAMLEELTEELRGTGAHTELVERMSGLVSLGRGAKDEALRTLRAATEAEQPAPQHARALLAYGVALAASGRTEGALLETLTALARTRAAGDRQGEHACARFLARLSSAAGHSAAAAAWAKVAQRTLE